MNKELKKDVATQQKLFDDLKVEFQKFVKGKNPETGSTPPPPLPPPPPRNDSTIDELKSSLMETFLAEDTADDIDLVQVLRRQAYLQATTLAQAQSQMVMV